MSNEDKRRLKEYQRDYRRSRQATKLFYLYFFLMYKNGIQSLDL